ncbi:L-ribulokinase [Catalinimonas alkaloidigena]|uniref:Ribulokinase n=1 Tax=Catalinimonas alkaloidigena TaxID=1075417 RepID=A0A1G9S6K3_9BACT|nr:ribulokinase [Catalinimonas alkaloidigena]SDM31148.1 L-ribulokinase [Catalinimonas alkaloidigena]
MKNHYVIGVDYGTDSVRSMIVDTHNGNVVGSAVYEYPRWKQGLYCDAPHSQFRQHPLDYLEGLESSITEALRQAPAEVAEHIIGISVDTTGSTPAPVDRHGTPLALLPEFAENPNAMFILWKDHTANQEAEEINTLAHNWKVDFTKYVGGIYSSEWFWAKILHTLRVDPAVREKAFSWIEHCDWVSAVLTGQTDPLALKRSRCAAGHKAMWHEEFDGLPSEEFLTTLDPLLRGLRGRLYRETYTSDQPMGTISPEWAEKLGISPEAVIGVGAFDAHMGGVGAHIEPYALVRVMGTSTCDMLIAPTDEVKDTLVQGICGQVDGSIIPGMLGMEAGQSAFGDVYAWLQRLVLGPVNDLIDDEATKKKLAKQLIPHLADQAAQLPVTENDPVALDWFNGRRTPDANHTLKGAMMGLNLGSDTARVFKALVEATAFGAKSIVDRFVDEGVPIRQVIGIGGVAKKSPFVMQTLADVLNMPIKIASADQACALGAAMCAAVAAGEYETMEEAQRAMSSGFDAVYEPRPEQSAVYQKLYEKYVAFGAFVEG